MKSSPRNWVVTVLGSLGVVLMLLGTLSFMNGPKSSGNEPQAIEAPVLTPRRLPEVMSDAANDQNLRNLVSQTVNSSGLDPVLISLSVDQDARDVLSRNATASRIPASSMKLTTAAASLKLIGADATFTTRVIGGEVKNGVLSGDLYLVGGGDPLLFTNQYVTAMSDAGAVHSSLEALADAVEVSGVRQIQGGVIGDDTRFDNARGVPTWSPSYLLQGQVGPISALSVDQGFSSFNAGKIPAQDPTTTAAQKFADLLRQRGITVSTASKAGVAPEKAKEIAKLQSPAVAQIVAQMLTFSDNTTAEIMLKNVGFKQSEKGTTQAGIDAVRAFLEAKGFPAADYVANDGSGLDRNDRLSCNLLDGVVKDPEVSDLLRQAMPKAAATGTLEDRMANSPAVGRVEAETGTLNDVSALVGWAAPQENNTYSFCMVTNGVAGDSGRVLEDRLATAIAGFNPTTSAETFSP